MKQKSTILTRGTKYTTAIISNYLKMALLAFSVLILSGGKPAEPDAKLIFKRVSDRLASLKTVSYRALRELNYPAESYLAKDSGKMYVDFAKANDIAGFRYQFRDERGFAIFNNSEVFNASTTDKTIRVTHRTKLANLEGKSALYNSMITLRNILPAVVQDDSIPKTVGDTVIEKRSYYLLTFVLRNKTLNYSGTNFSKTTQPFTFTYKIVADKSTSLPRTLIQRRSSSSDLVRTDFMDINIKPVAPAENSWYYSSYLKEFTLTDDKPVAIIASGKTAPDWELTNYRSDTKETMAQYKGKVVLLEFWIRHCGYCIEAVPKLNQLHDKFKGDKFQLLAINTEASRENIQQFDSKHPMKYTVMYGDNADVNKSYGIGAFPLVVLIGKDGKVIYSGGLDVEKLTGLIEENM